MRDIRDWNWDRLGIVLSSLCLVHCIVTPFLILSVPVLSSVLEHETFHLLMAFLLLPVTALAFWHGYRRHHERWALFVGYTGILILFLAIWIEELWHLDVAHTLITIGGSGLLIFAHIWNRRLCRSHSCAVHRPS